MSQLALVLVFATMYNNMQLFYLCFFLSGKHIGRCHGNAVLYAYDIVGKARWADLSTSHHIRREFIL